MGEPQEPEPGSAEPDGAPVHRRRRDRADKALFAHALPVEHLVRGFVAERIDADGTWVEDLDFSTLERLPTEHIAPNLSSRINDTVWRVRFRDAEAGETGGWVHVLVMVEFQSALDWFMALRIRTYADLLYGSLWKDRRALRGDRLPALLPVVLYTGAPRWTAASSVEALVVAPIGPVALPATAAVFTGASYVVVDAGAYAGRDLPRDNVVSLMIGAQLRPDAARALDIVAAARRLDESLGRTFLTWLRVAMSGTGVELEFLEDPMAMERLEHTGELGGLLEERFRAAHAAQSEAARAEGREAVRAEERALLCRLAARKFGAATAERLAVVLSGMDDGDRLAVVGERIIDCADGAALLAGLESQA